MYQKILVPLDGSAVAECALVHARTVAIGLQVPEVVLLATVEPLHRLREVLQPQTLAKTEVEADLYLKKVAEDMKKEGITATTVLKISDDPATEILNYVQNNDVGLIIMSTHGRSGPSRWAFGSVADRVVRHSIVPVTIIPPEQCRTAERGQW